MRSQTRNERYFLKKKIAVKLPLSVVTVNFMFDDNLAFVIRTALCYGVNNVYVIGSCPSEKLLKRKSGGLAKYANICTFATPSEFLEFSRDKKYNLVSAELADDSENIFNYEFDFASKTCLVLGHETTGVPPELLLHSDSVFIPMLGIGWCLNTSQSGTAIMTEYVRQFLRWRA